MQTLFSPKTKLAEMIQVNYKLLFVFRRLGVKLGFGEMDVQQAAEKYGIPTDFILMICHLHTIDNLPIQPENLNPKRITDIIDYLHNSHSYYKEEVPKLHRKLDEMVASCEPIHHKIIERFFEDYEKELINHFDYEEEEVFPYIRSLLNGKPASGYSIEQFEKNHSNIEEKLNDLKSIIIKYLPGNCSDAKRMDVLLDIYLLEDDLGKHTLLENKLLIPMVTKLENHAGN